MKSATIPSLRVEPELREAAESVLHDGETLSSFVEQSIKAQIARRSVQQAFIARGLAARDEASRAGDYIDADIVLADLREMLANAKRNEGSKP